MNKKILDNTFTKTSDLYNKYLSCSKAAIDSRKIGEDAMFFGIKGPNFNGNSFAKEALKQGAKYVVIDDPKYYIDDKRYILVQNTIVALQKLALFHRKRFKIPIIAITGSCGKTITKDLLKSIFSKKFKTFASHGNLNSHTGLPMTLLSMPEDTEIAILEMGSRGFGQINELCQIAMPTHGLITCIKEVHLDGFGDLEGVLKGKLELFNYISSIENASSFKNKIFINYDDPMLNSVIKKFDNALIFSCKEKGQSSSNFSSFYNCKLIETDDINISYQDHYKNIITTQIFGSFNINNIAAASCIAKFFGIESSITNNAIKEFKNQNNRLEIIKKGNNTIVLDAYNSNFDALKGAIQTIKKFNKKNNVLIIGEMNDKGIVPVAVGYELTYSLHLVQRVEAIQVCS